MEPTEETKLIAETKPTVETTPAAETGTGTQPAAEDAAPEEEEGNSPKSEDVGFGERSLMTAGKTLKSAGSALSGAGSAVTFGTTVVVDTVVLKPIHAVAAVASAPFKPPTPRTWSSILQNDEDPTDEEEARSNVFRNVPLYGAIDSVTYNAGGLGSLRTLGNLSFTVWKRPAILITAMVLLMTSTVTALLVMLVVKSPHQLDASKWEALSNILNSFVGLLLGFFMSTSMSRWYACMTGFLQVFDSVRALQRQLYSLGVPTAQTDNILRFGVLSSRMLTVDMHLKAMHDHSKERVEEMWGTIAAGRGLYTSITDQEMETLRQTADPPGTIWTWVAMFIGRLSQDGWVPPMGSPTYGAIMETVESARKGIRDARTSTIVTPPFIYVQMLAALVHINNIIDAIGFGLTLGAAWATALQEKNLGVYSDEDKVTKGHVARDTQDVIVSMFFGFFGPLIYQALLEVSIAIAQPFSSEDGEIPTRWLLHNLENDLLDNKRAASQLPKGWLQPHFKEPPQPPQQPASGSKLA